MTLSYEIIFSRFLGNITDYDFVNMDMVDANEFMVEKLHAVLSKPYIRRLFSSAELDDEIQTFKFEMSHPDEESADNDFVINILSKGMVVEWLEPLVVSKLNLMQYFGTKEGKHFSQSQHLSVIEGLLENKKNEVRKSIRDRGYISNEYLDG